MRLEPARAIAELFAAVWANPDDDATKLVLADALIAIGDPRGELIQLQFASRQDESGAMRLLQRHGLTWLGALRGKVVPLAYEKGFLASCIVIEPDPAPREWTTVHTVQLQEVSHLAMLDALPRVRAVIELEPEILAALLGRPAAGRLVSLGATDAHALFSHHAALDALPALGEVTAPLHRLRRGADGRLSALDARWSEALLDLFDVLPPDSLVDVRIVAIPHAEVTHVQYNLMHFTRCTGADLVEMSADENRWYEARLHGNG